MKNLTCGDQQILLLVILFILTKGETEEIETTEFISLLDLFQGEWGTIKVACTYLGNCC